MGNLLSIYEPDRTDQTLNQYGQKHVGLRAINPIKAGQTRLCLNKIKDFRIARKKRFNKISNLSSNGFFPTLKNVQSLKTSSLHLKIMISDRKSIKNFLTTLRNFNALTTLTLELSSYITSNGGVVAKIHNELRQLCFLSTLNLTILNLNNDESIQQLHQSLKRLRCLKSVTFKLNHYNRMSSKLETLPLSLIRLRLLSDLNLLFSFISGAHGIPMKFFNNLQYLKSIRVLTVSLYCLDGNVENLVRTVSRNIRHLGSLNTITFKADINAQLSQKSLQELFDSIRGKKSLSSINFMFQQVDHIHLRRILYNILAPESHVNGLYLEFDIDSLNDGSMRREVLAGLATLPSRFQLIRLNITFRRFYKFSQQEINGLFSCLSEHKQLKSLSLELKECNAYDLKVLESLSNNLKRMNNLSFLNLCISGNPGPNIGAVRPLFSSLNKLSLLSTVIISIKTNHKINVKKLKNMISNQKCFKLLSYISLEFYGYGQLNEYRRYVFNQDLNISKVQSSIES